MFPNTPSAFATMDPAMKAVLVVGGIVLLVLLYRRWQGGQPSLKQTLNAVLSHPEPLHKTSVEYIVEKCVPKPPSPEELRAVVDAHKAGAGPLALPPANYVTLTSGDSPTAGSSVGTSGSPASPPSGGPSAAGASTPDLSALLAQAQALTKTQ